MDNLTHTLVGATLGRAGLAPRTAGGMAALMISANIPDLDVLGLPFGWNLAFRRGVTHGVPALLLWPIVVTVLVVGWYRWRRPSDPAPDPRQFMLLSAVGAASHPLLDWFNSYGMRWLMPLRDTWWYGDTWFIVDPWVLGVLAFALLGSRPNRDGVRPRRPAQLAMAAVAIYAVVMGIGSAVGRRHVAVELERLGFDPPRAIMVTPVAVNSLQRQVVIDDGEAYHLGTLSLAAGLRLDPADRIVTEMATVDTAVLAADRQASQFLYWARFPFARVHQEGDTTVTQLDDARYSDGSRRSFAWTEVRSPARR